MKTKSQLFRWYLHFSLNKLLSLSTKNPFVDGKFRYDFAVFIDSKSLKIIVIFTYLLKRKNSENVFKSIYPYDKMLTELN